jgi:hypothetical protein
LKTGEQKTEEECITITLLLFSPSCSFTAFWKNINKRRLNCPSISIGDKNLHVEKSEIEYQDDHNNIKVMYFFCVI